MRFIAQHLSQPGDLICDCFFGIGTSLVAAKELGRRYFGCDIWGPYCDKARERLEETKGLPTPLEQAKEVLGVESSRKGWGRGAGVTGACPKEDKSDEEGEG
jgi:DNA modification methylase